MAIAGEEPDNAPPRSVADASELRSRAESARSRSPPIYSPAPKSKASATLIGPNGFGTSYPERAGSKINAGRDDVAGDDVDSNVQDGVRSEVGEIVPPVRLQSSRLFLSISSLIPTAARTWSSRSTRSKIRIL